MFSENTSRCATTHTNESRESLSTIHQPLPMQNSDVCEDFCLFHTYTFKGVPATVCCQMHVLHTGLGRALAVLPPLTWSCSYPKLHSHMPGSTAIRELSPLESYQGESRCPTTPKAPAGSHASDPNVESCQRPRQWGPCLLSIPERKEKCRAEHHSQG